MKAQGCAKCQELGEQLASSQARVEELESKLAKAGKNSRNSSKPPSSDIVKPPPRDEASGKKKKKRKRGGQPGHKRHEREPFAEHEIDKTWDYTWDACPDCGGPVTLTDDKPRVVQQVELVEKPVKITEHRGLPYWCEGCQKLHYAPVPEDIRRAGLAGPRLTTLVGFMKSVCHASFSTIRKFMRDVVKIKLSRSYLRKLCAKVSDSLDEPYDELLKLLPDEAALNVDETGHKDNGKRMWTWCFRASLYTLFKIDSKRSSKVLIDVLGEEFQGVIGCDYFGAYRKYMREFDVCVQFCLAHFIRDVKFLVEHPNSKNRAYGHRVLEATRALFKIIHRRDEMTEAAFRVELENAGDALCAEGIYQVPDTNEANNLANRFHKHGDSYIRFITTPGIDPTNNLAEQAIRFVVIDRLITQGSRSEAGQHWLERIWTMIATCTQQSRSVFQFLFDAIKAHFAGQPAPSLVPDTS